MSPDPARSRSWAGSGDATQGRWSPTRLEALTGELAGAVRSGGADVIVGLAQADDAGVVRLSDDLALVTAVELLVPMVDDAACLGAIAAAHACGKVLAMGARLVSASIIAVVPDDIDDSEVLAACRSAADVVAEAGGAVVGGHTSQARSPLFGLAVQGVGAPGALWSVSGAQPGDALVVSKRVGTGLVLADGTVDERRRAVDSMRALNRPAAEALGLWGARVHAVTDVGTRGLAGSAWRLARRSGVAAVIDRSLIPYTRGAKAASERRAAELADEASGGSAASANGRAIGANREAVRPHLHSDLDLTGEALVFDPQISGGLLAAIDPGLVLRAVEAGFVMVGEVQDRLPAVVLR